MSAGSSDLLILLDSTVRTYAASQSRFAKQSPGTLRSASYGQPSWSSVRFTPTAAPAMRLSRSRATTLLREQGPRRASAQSSAKSRGRKPPARNFQVSRRRHRAPQLPFRAALGIGVRDALSVGGARRDFYPHILADRAP